MPTYTYRCENCGLQFDKVQKFTEQPLVRCPECGKKSLHKVYTPVGIVFKGSGFYATDHRSPSGMSYASSGHAEEKISESKGEASNEGKSSAKPDSKAETKAETSGASNKE